MGGLADLEAFATNASAVLTAGQNLAAIGSDSTTRSVLLEDFGKALWAFTAPYWAALAVVEHFVNGDVFRADTFREVLGRGRAFEAMADRTLSAVEDRDYFDHILTAAPLLSLQACNDRMKDCLTAIECMLDPGLDEVMANALEEHQGGKTVSLDSIR